MGVWNRVSRHIRLIAMIVALVGASLPASGRAQEATPAAECVATTPAENEALITAFWDEVVWGPQGKVAEIVSPDEVHHWGIDLETTGFDAFEETYGLFLASFPDIRYTVDLLAAEGDMVASRQTATATQSGEWRGIAPTNKEVVWQGINIFRIECGQIAEAWGEANHFGLLAQLGSPDVPAFFADVAVTEATPMASNAAATPCAGDTPEANVALVERWFTDVWTDKKLDVLDEIAAPDIVHHAGGFPDTHGVQAIKDVVASFPEASLGVDFAFTDGDLVVARWSGQGTLGGDFLGDQPSDQVVPMTGINIHRIICGKIVESWSQISGLSMLKAVEAAAAAATPTD